MAAIFTGCGTSGEVPLPAAEAGDSAGESGGGNTPDPSETPPTTPDIDTPTQSSATKPFHGAPISLPGKIEAEDYDENGAETAFSDSSIGNAGMMYRQNDVDIENANDTGAGYNIGWIDAGEWLKYSVHIAKTGVYQVTARIAAKDQTGVFHLELDGKALGEKITVPVTGAWQTWATTPSMNIHFNDGNHTLTVVCDSALFNINHLEFKLVSDSIAVPAPIDLKATAENNNVAVTWKAASGILQYRVERRESTQAAWTILSTQIETSYADKNITAGNRYHYRIVALAGNIASAPSIEAAVTIPNPPVMADGAKLYTEQCASCHGADGLGGVVKKPLTAKCSVCTDSLALASIIDQTMPFGNPSACDAKCSSALSSYIITNFINTDSGNATPNPSASCNDMQPAPRVLRLLTRHEYQNTVRDLLGTKLDVSANLPVEATVRGYDNNAKVAVVTSRHIDELQNAAQRLADEALTSGSVPFMCARGIALDQCAKSFVPNFARLAFRRPLSSEEIQTYSAFFNTDLASSNLETATKLAIQAMLISPNFLYRSELGAAKGALFQLDGYEIAASLSYLFWGTTPDTQLLDAAKAGRFTTAAGIREQAEKMIGDDRAKDQLTRFALQWLGAGSVLTANKDKSIYPTFTDEVRDAMHQELRSMVNYAIYNSSGKFQELLVSDTIFSNATLAKFYGISGVFGNTISPTNDTSTQRGGLLTLGSVLASQAHSNESSPIKRGKFVRERLLCQDLTPPPPNLDTTPPGLDPKLTTRERFAKHTANAGCASCHQFIDGVGFGFERYDGVGAYRAKENGIAVDDSGTLVGLESLTNTDKVTFNGVKELSTILANSKAAPACFARQYYRFSYGLNETPADECSINSLAQKFADNSYNIKSLMLDLVTASNFTLRRAAEE